METKVKKVNSNYSCKRLRKFTVAIMKAEGVAWYPGNDSNCHPQTLLSFFK